MKELIQKLVESVGPSGYEDGVRSLIKQEVAGLGDEMKVDALGNLIVRKGSQKADGLRIMLSAHMDEIGLIATHIDEKGFVRFTTIGGVRPHTLPGGRVRFLNGVRGVINHDRSEELARIPGVEKYFIDVGATSDKDCPVKVGDVAVFDREFLDMGKRVSSKAMDDRVACAVLIETMRNIKTTLNELVFVFSTQEEVQSRGAQTAAYAIEADLGIAVDVTPSGDILGVKMQVYLGQGPAIKVRDVGMIADPKVVKWMADTAKKNQIPCQMEVLDVGSTDARTMQIARSGMLAGALSIPCRYVHSPSELVDMDDITQSVKLLTALLSERIQL